MTALRLHIITEEDPFYLPVFFREFFLHLPADRFVVTGVDATPPLNQKSAGGLARKLYAFYGPWDFTRLGCRYALARAKDRLLPRGAWEGTVRRIVAGRGIAFGEVSNVNLPEYVARLRGLEPDLLISVAASQVFKPELLAVPHREAINIHTGTLPKYRGMLPVFWQLYDGQPTIGITIHTMTPRIDLGEVLLHREVPIENGESLDGTIRRMKREGARAMLELLGRYQAGTVSRRAMDHSQAGYRSFPGRAEAHAFRRMGRRLL
jgi:methionyl-tRNA formyltransferase